LDLLKERGIIGPADGARPRDVLVSDISEVLDEDELNLITTDKYIIKNNCN
jgi:hypothetical protein